VRSEKGHQGGWMLGKPLSEITLLDIHNALGTSSIFAVGLSTDHPQCLVEQAVNAALNQAFDDAQALLLQRLGEVTLAQLADDFDERYRVASARWSPRWRVPRGGPCGSAHGACAKAGCRFSSASLWISCPKVSFVTIGVARRLTRYFYVTYGVS
jgi:hypothetical protein